MLEIQSGRLTCWSSAFEVHNFGLLLVNSAGTQEVTAISTCKLFNHPGATVARSTSGAARIATAFQNEGAVIVGSGTLNIASAAGPVAIDTGQYLIDPGATLEVTGARRYAAGFSVAGSGRFRIRASLSTVTFDADVATTPELLELQSGILAVNGTMTVTDRLDWSGGDLGGSGVFTIGEDCVATLDTNGNKTLQNTITLVNMGEVVHSNGLINTSGAGTPEIINEGLWTITDQDRTNIRAITTLTPFRNKPQGVLVVDADSEVQIGAIFENEGALFIQRGKLIVRGSSSGNREGFSTGLIDIAENARLRFILALHTLDQGVEILGGGTLISESTRITIPAGVELTLGRLELDNGPFALAVQGGLKITDRLLWQSGDIGGAGVLSIDEDAFVHITGPSTRHFTSQITVNNSGAVFRESGAVSPRTSDAASFNNAGLVEITSEGAFGVNTFTNLPAGTIVRDGQGATLWYGLLHNQGFVFVDEGSLVLHNTPGSVDTGAYVIAQGASLENRSSRTLRDVDVFGPGEFVHVEGALLLDGLVTAPGLRHFVGTIDLGDSTLVLSGDLVRTSGSFVRGTSTVIFDALTSDPLRIDLGANTFFTDLVIAEGTTLVEVQPLNRIFVRGELDNRGVIRKTFEPATGENIFGLTGVVLNATDTGDIEAITVERVAGPHPLADLATLTEEHWRILAQGTGYSGSIALPHAAANHEHARVCRLDLIAWDCDRTSSGELTVTRAGITDPTGDWVAPVASPCIADLNADGVVDADDFFLFLQLFADADPRADFNNDGVIDADDFFAFLAAFAQGC